MLEISFYLTCFSVGCSSSSTFKDTGELELLCIAAYTSAKELLDAFQTAWEWRLDVDVVTPPLSSASAIPTSSSKWVTACGNTEIKWKVMDKMIIKAFRLITYAYIFLWLDSCHTAKRGQVVSNDALALCFYSLKHFHLFCCPHPGRSGLCFWNM